MTASLMWRRLRALRFEPPGHARARGRRTAFQAALEQSEQFMDAAGSAGYATKPVQLFYALSQAARAIVAASPLVSNHAWSPVGHGLSTGRDPAADVADVTVVAATRGLFTSVAEALGVSPLTPDEAVPLRDLWPLLPETVEAPLTVGVGFPGLLFFPDCWPKDGPFSTAHIDWIPNEVKARCGEDPGRLQEFLSRYPSLSDARLQATAPAGSFWSESGRGLLRLDLEWRTGESPLLLLDSKSLAGLGIPRYRDADDPIVTPSVGSMSSGLHPLLALWAVLLGLSSLARYEPARWAKAIDVDRSREANAIEHLMNAASNSIPLAVYQALQAFT